MKEPKRIIMLYSLLYSAFIATIFLIIPSSYVKEFLAHYLLSIILFSILSSQDGFIFLIIYIFGTAFINLVKAFSLGFDISLQILAIATHISTIANVAIAYAFIYSIKKIDMENSDLKAQIKNMLDYVGPTKLLTKQEYTERKTMILKAMHRRKEQGFEIFFSLKNKNDKTRDALFDKLSYYALKNFRNDYDLVGKLDEYCFAVLLQNTNEAGMNIALSRYFDIVQSDININKEDIDMKIAAIDYTVKAEEEHVFI